MLYNENLALNSFTMAWRLILVRSNISVKSKCRCSYMLSNNCMVILGWVAILPSMAVVRNAYSILKEMTASVVKRSEFLASEGRCIVFPVRYKLNLYMLCRRK
jgi:hypothetical protein